MTSMQLLRAIGEFLVDIHAANENQSLLKEFWAALLQDILILRLL